LISVPEILVSVEIFNAIEGASLRGQNALDGAVEIPLVRKDTEVIKDMWALITAQNAMMPLLRLGFIFGGVCMRCSVNKGRRK